MGKHHGAEKSSLGWESIVSRGNHRSGQEIMRRVGNHRDGKVLWDEKSHPARLAAAGAGGTIAMGTDPYSAVCPQQTPPLPTAMADRFPLRLPTASQVPGVSFTAPAVPPPVTASVLPSGLGLMVSGEPAQLHPVTYQLGPATVWQGVPGPLGAPGQLVQLPPVVQLPHGGQLPPMPPPCPPAYGWGQQVAMGTLVPHQPMGLGPWSMAQGEPMYPTGSHVLHVPAHPGPLSPHCPAAQHGVQGPPVLHTLPGSAQKLSKAFKKHGDATNDSNPAASPLQQAPAPSGTMMKPKAAVTTPAAPGKPLDLPEQGPAPVAKAFPEQADNTIANHTLTWVNTTDCEDTVPDVPDSPSLSAFLDELPDLSEYVAKGGCPKEQVVVVEPGDSEDTIPDIPDFTALLYEVPDFSGAEGRSPQERVAGAGLGDGEVAIDTVPNSSNFFNQLPDFSQAESGCNKEQVPAEVLVDAENTFPDIPDSLSSSPSFSEFPDILDYGVEGDRPKDRLAAAMLGNNDPFWGVAASPLQEPKEERGRVVAERPTWLPLSPLETPEGSSPEETSGDSPVESPHMDPLKTPTESPRLSPLPFPLLSPLASPPNAPQRHLPPMAQLVEEALQRQLRVALTRLPLPPGIVSCQVVTRLVKAGGKQAKGPTPASSSKTREASPRDNMPAQKRKKTMVCRLEEHSKTLREEKPGRDGGGRQQQAARGQKQEEGIRHQQRAQKASKNPERCWKAEYPTPLRPLFVGS